MPLVNDLLYCDPFLVLADFGDRAIKEYTERIWRVQPVVVR